MAFKDNPNYVPITSSCEHWKMSMPRFGSCKGGHFSGKIVTPNVCHTCPDYKGESRGLGDTVHKVLKKVGIGRKKKGCGGCQSRREKLNDLFSRDNKK
tara:strand:- start:3138 stop:3431 length:294 start_codon:yes stop_codon:yes gene_type:complete